MGSWNKGHFLIVSISIHLMAFIFIGAIALNNTPGTPQEFVNIQLAKAKQQARKLRQIIPEYRSYAAANARMPKESQYAAHPLLSPGSVPIQTTTEVISVFQYMPLDIKDIKEVRICPRITPQRKPLAVPKVTVSKPISHTYRESVFELHDQLSRLSSSYSPDVSFSDSKESNSAVLRDFLRIVSRRIEKSKCYPGWAMDTGLEGRVVVRFTILRDGTLNEELQLVKSSGVAILDNAAIAAIKAAAPFPELPRSLNRESIQIELPMEFRLTES